MNKRKSDIIVGLVFVFLCCLILSEFGLSVCLDDTPTVTNSSVFYWGKAVIKGKEVQTGYEIRAYIDSVVVNGGCVGKYVVETPGYYGSMALYGDDFTTNEKDGAENGDVVHFVVCHDGVEYTCKETSAWNISDELVEMDLTCFADNTYKR